MPPLIDLTDRAFGRLRVESDSGERYTDPRGKAGAVLWLCHCDPVIDGCGARVVVAGHNLQSGNTRSCGCLHVDVCTGRRRRGRPRPLTRAVRIDAESLRLRRLDAGLTQFELADAARLTRGLVCQYEMGYNRHSHPAVVARLASAMGCTPGDLTDAAVSPGRERGVEDAD
jgi:hypothetical protein